MKWAPRRSNPVLWTLVLSLLAAGPAGAGQLEPDPDDGGITLPDGFRALVVADDLGTARHVAVAADGDVYVKLQGGGIAALRDLDGDGRADVKAVIAAPGGTGLALHGGWLYYSSTTTVYRARLAAGALVPAQPPQIIVSGLPDERTHAARAIAFDGDGRLYVEVGAPSNASGDPDRSFGAKGKDPGPLLERHGGFWRFDPDTPGQTQADGLHFSSGQRHILAVAWNPVSQALFVVQNGRDQLHTVDPDHYTEQDNAELPAEEMHVLREGANLGWPYTYWDPMRHARMLAPEWGGDNAKLAEKGKYPDPLVAFPAHWAPMQLTFYEGTQFPERYRGGAFVAFHGSWNRAPEPQKGYKVAFVPFDAQGMPTGDYEIFADGFAGKPEIASPGDARYRPNGVAVGPDGSLYVSDSQKGRLWRVFYTGEARRANAAPATPQRPPTASEAAGSGPAPSGATVPADDLARGARLYETYCATCHMRAGGGVPNMQPALTQGLSTRDDPTALIRAALSGSEGMPANRTAYDNKMPPFGSLEDADLAAVLSYVRVTFGGRSDGVTPEQVAAQR